MDAPTADFPDVSDHLRLDETLAQVGDMPRAYGTYRTVLDPLTVKLKRFTQWPGYLKDWPLAVCWGDWDLGGPGQGPFREEKTQQLLCEQVPYRETRRYKEMVAELTANGITGWVTCRSLEEIDRYIRRVFELYETIKRDGYQPRPAGAPGREITVRIGRDGTITKCGQGTHRFAMVRLLRLPAVPVVVDLVHWDWAVQCQKKWQTSSIRPAVEQELAEIAARTEANRDRSAAEGHEPLVSQAAQSW